MSVRRDTPGGTGYTHTRTHGRPRPVRLRSRPASGRGVPGWTDGRDLACLEPLADWEVWFLAGASGCATGEGYIRARLLRGCVRYLPDFSGCVRAGCLAQIRRAEMGAGCVCPRGRGGEPDTRAYTSRAPATNQTDLGCHEADTLMSGSVLDVVLIRERVENEAE